MKSLRIKVVAALLALFLLGVVSGVRVAHPYAGLSNALGSAKSGIVIYKKTGVVAIGAKIIVSTPDSSHSSLGIVTNQTAGKIQVQVGTSSIRVNAKQVHGTLIAVVPFLGYLLSWIGL
jgi:hypothetical protein